MRRMRIEASIPGPMYMSMEGGGDEKRMQQASLLFSKFPTRVGPASSSTSSIEPALPMVRVCLSVDYRVHSRQMLCVGGSAIPLGWSFLSGVNPSSAEPGFDEMWDGKVEPQGPIVETESTT